MSDPDKKSTQNNLENVTEVAIQEAFDRLFAQAEDTKYNVENGIGLWADLRPIRPILTREEIREKELARLRKLSREPDGQIILRCIANVKRKNAGLSPLDDNTDVLTDEETIELFVDSGQEAQKEYATELRYHLSDTQLTKLADVLNKMGIIATGASIHTMQIWIRRPKNGDHQYSLGLAGCQTLNPEDYSFISKYFSEYLANHFNFGIYRFTSTGSGEASDTFLSRSFVYCPREISDPDVEACDLEQFREEERTLRQILMKCTEAAVLKPREEPFTTADVELIETITEFLSSIPGG